MAKISTYPSVSPAELTDKLIGTETNNNNATKNFTIQSILDLITPVNVSFNPQFTDAGGLLAGVTSSGSYTLIGDICYFRVYVDFAGCSNFGTTQYQITLPFPSIETMRQAGGTLHETTGASLYHIAGITDTAVSNTIHKLYYSGSTTDLAWKNTTPVGGTTVTSHFDISGVYQIA